MLCLTGALALATASCKDEKVTTMQTITVNGQICEVKSAFYVEEKADEQWETSYDLILFREYFSTLPFTMSDYGVDIEVSESLIGKTIDLTEPVTQTGPLRPYLSVGAIGETEFDIVHSFERITVSNGDDISSATVSYGMLTVTRDGDNFSVKLSVKLSDGKSIFADWKSDQSNDSGITDRIIDMRPACVLQAGRILSESGSYAFAPGTLARMVSVKARMIEFLT